MAREKAKQIQIPQPHVAHSKPRMGGLLQAEPAYDQQGKSPGSIHLQAHHTEQKEDGSSSPPTSPGRGSTAEGTQ